MLYNTCYFLYKSVSTYELFSNFASTNSIHHKILVSLHEANAKNYQ